MATTPNKSTTVKEKAVMDKTKKEVYISDPFFVKKREMSLKLIKKSGLPDSFTKKKT